MASIDAICAKLQPNSAMIKAEPEQQQKGCAQEKTSEPCDSKDSHVAIRDGRKSSESEADQGDQNSSDGTSGCRNKRKNFKPQMLVKAEPTEANAEQGAAVQEAELSAGAPEAEDQEEVFRREELTSPESSNNASIASPCLLHTVAGAQLPTTTDALSPPIIAHYDGFIVRYFGAECGLPECHSFASIKEHFHCKRCEDKLFTKKDEMLRHFKWHRKRDESLAQGFMRFSANDNCAAQFPSCTHNMRQTHYHCLQEDCDRVYISTSDVQMHSNSHRKAAHIAREGFQRFKASEDCGRVACPFTQPRCRTTHFHCLRPGCSHSFKNKSDMDESTERLTLDKHKAHHVRDEQFMRDGFKKFMKSDHCPFLGCLFSRVLNHTHCIRPGCTYVLHSTSQMQSHKRKHEKEEKTVAEARPRLRQPFATAQKSATSPAQAKTPRSENADETPVINLENLQKPIDMLQQVTAKAQETPPLKMDQLWTKYVKRFTANDQCHARCAMVWSDHYHCVAEEPCNAVFRNKDGAREHGWKHQTLAQSAMYYNVFDTADECRVEDCSAKGAKHYHCNWPDCTETILAEEPVFRRLEHFQWHERLATEARNGGMRKRGRPPKNFSDLYIRTDLNGSNSKPSPEQEGPSPKRGRPRTVSSPVPQTGEPGNSAVPRYLTVTAEQTCSHANCALTRQLHYHCNVPNCFYAMNNVDFVEMHVRDFHDSIEIPDGFACYDRTYPCGYSECPFDGRCRHFHCMKPLCRMPLAKFNLLGGHVHSENEPEPAGQQVKAAGTFYPGPLSPRMLEASCQIPSNSSVFTRPHSLFPMPPPPFFSGLPYTTEKICGNPYCKLKKQIHHHCKQCSKGFVDLAKLQQHLQQKHGLPNAPLYAFGSELPMPFSVPEPMNTTPQKPTSRNEVHSLIQSIVRNRAGPQPQPGPTVPHSQAHSEPVDLRQSILDTITGKRAQSLKKFKIHMFQPELMKFTTAQQSILSAAEYAAINESLKSVLVGNTPPGQKRYKFVDLTPSEALID